MHSLSTRCEDVLNEHHLMKKKALRKHLVQQGAGVESLDGPSLHLLAF